MRKLLWLALSIALLWTQADGATINRPTKSFGGTSFINNVVPVASDFNGDVDTIYSDYNGNITNVNISASAAIAGSKIAPDFTANPSITNSAPCTKLIESDQGADLRRWDICVDAQLWGISTMTDAGAVVITPITIARATGNVNWFGKFTKYNNLTPTDGQLLIGKTSTNTFEAATLTGTTNQLVVTNAGGTITLSTPQNTHTGASPTFTGLNLSGLTATTLAAVDGSKNFISYAGAAACTNQFVTAISAAGGTTCTTATLASAQYANQGTTTTVLHGNAAGNPSFAAVDIVNDTSGTLTVSKGGTGAAPGADDQVLVADSTSAATWRSVPNCTDTTGNHLNYTQSTNSFSCGTTVASGAPGTLTVGTSLVKNPIANTSSTTQAHGLGVRPKFFDVQLENLTANCGYSSGDIVSLVGYGGAGTSGIMFHIYADSTNVTLLMGPATVVAVLNKTTQANCAVTEANWKLTIVPYKLN